MPDPTILNPPKTSVIPPQIAAVIQGAMTGGGVEPGATDASSTLPPQSVLDALTSDSNVPPAPSFLANQPHNNPEPTDPLADIAGSMKGRFDQQKPQLAPPTPPKESLGHKIMRFLPMAGAVGGALEAAAGPVGRPAQGAEMLQHEFDTERAAAAKREELNKVEIPKARAYSDYMSGRNETTENVAGTRAGAQTTVANTNAASRSNVANINAESKAQIAALQMGAPMTITPQMAQVAGQPELAGKQLAGKSLGNFMKVFTATGAGIHDLGEEGLWAVDRMGNRIARVSVSSPSVGRANAFAEAKAKNTPVNVIQWDDNGTPSVKAISQAEQLKTGTPTAQTEQSIVGPTSATRTMGQMASTVTPHLEGLKSEIQELAPYLGPLMGRGMVNFAAGTVGSTGNPELDYKLGKLMSDFKLASSAVGRTHFAGRTGLPAAQYFGELFNAKRSPQELMGVLDSVPSYIEGYSANSAIAPQPRTGTSAPAQFGTQKQKAAPKKDSLGIL